MVVEFTIRSLPRIPVASIVRIGPWKEENLRTEFGELERWARGQRVRSGRWIFLERGRHRWEACLELKGTAEPSGRIRLKTLPAARAACLVFDPDRVSSRVVYHALRDWTRARRRDGALGRITSIREVYPGDPWKDPNAWAHCEVQFVAAPRPPG
ncbi:MAG TPA: GyrI-like domain-containing protein [Thermoplasmata archaeon]|nr:GyrI-like domain-containing protein [Thermoplasmata archaeon]